MGNVTKYYYDLFRDVYRDVVDRDEKAYGVINIDIYDYRPSRTYDFIYSISTFEYMTEDVRIRNLSPVYDNLLSKDGLFILTFPIGLGLDHVSISYLQKIVNLFKQTNVYYFKRVSEKTWRPIDVPFEHNGSLQRCICIIEIIK